MYGIGACLYLIQEQQGFSWDNGNIEIRRQLLGNNLHVQVTIKEFLDSLVTFKVHFQEIREGFYQPVVHLWQAMVYALQKFSKFLTLYLFAFSNISYLYFIDFQCKDSIFIRKQASYLSIFMKKSEVFSIPFMKKSEVFSVHFTKKSEVFKHKIRASQIAPKGIKGEM